MLKKRLIPVLFLKEGNLVRSQSFTIHQYIGDPISHVKRMMDWNVDELIIIDIDPEEFSFQKQRNDHKSKPINTMTDFTKLISEELRIPLALGGKIRSLDDIKLRIQNGADKVIINYLLSYNHTIVEKAVEAFGSQAIVASVDYKVIDNEAIVFTDHGKNNKNLKLLDWTLFAEKCGVGELFLNCIDRDGTAKGFDLENIDKISKALNIPVIACGGAGSYDHFLDCFLKTEASAVAAGNIFHFKENFYPISKNFLLEKINSVRP